MEDCIALEGPVFRAMPATELIPLLPRLRVLARSSPEDKLTLVALLKKQGEVRARVRGGVQGVWAQRLQGVQGRKAARVSCGGGFESVAVAVAATRLEPRWDHFHDSSGQLGNTEVCKLRYYRSLQTYRRTPALTPPSRLSWTANPFSSPRPTGCGCDG